MSWHVVRLGRFGYLIHLLVGWLIDFARDCPNRDNAKVYKPANQQVNQITELAQPNDMPRHTWSKVTTTPVTSTSELVAFCVNCAQTGHSFATCNQKEVPEEQVYAAWSYHAQSVSATKTPQPTEEPRDTIRTANLCSKCNLD